MAYTGQYVGGDPAANPRGLETVLEYNGLYLNDREAGADCYVITDIDGLADANIRDSREDNPARHGQTTYASFYSGRNVTLTGYIKAGNLDKLRQMNYELHSAFSGLQELPLKFNYNNFYDDFSSDSSGYYTLADATLFGIDAAFTDFDISGGRAFHENSATSILAILYDRTERTVSDCKITTHITTDSAIYGQCLSHILKTNNSSDYIITSLNTSGSLEVAIGSIGSLGASDLFSVSLDTDYWMVSSIIGNEVTIELWLAEPDDNSLPYQSATVTLAGANAAAFGEGVYGRQGLAWFGYTYGSTVFVNDFNFEAIKPADTYILCKKNGPIASVEKQEHKYFRRNFQISLAASDPRIYSSALMKKTKVPTTTTLKGRTYPKEFEYEYTTLLDSEYYVSNTENTLTVENVGNFDSYPVIKLEGVMSNPILYNITNGTKMIFGVDIAAGDYYLVDLLNREVLDSYGVNRIGSLSSDSNFLFLSPGGNIVTLGVEDYSDTSLMTILYRHAWI